jgi:hypothetical protein
MFPVIQNGIRLQPQAPTQPKPIAPPPGKPVPAKPTPIVIPPPTSVPDPDRRDDVDPGQFPHPVCPTRDSRDGNLLGLHWKPKAHQ